jgi:hypothetical protein
LLYKFLAALVIEPRALYMLGSSLPLELLPQHFGFVLFWRQGLTTFILAVLELTILLPLSPE